MARRHRRAADRAATLSAGSSWQEPPPQPPTPTQTPMGPAAPANVERPEDLDTRLLAHTWNHFPVSTLPEDWTVDKVRQARREHDGGDFSASVRLHDVLTTDPRIYAASGQRVATPTTLPWEVCPGPDGNGRGAARIAAEEAELLIAPGSACMPPHVVRRAVDDMVWFGVAILQLIWTPRADGSRWDFRVEPWPMQWVRWNTTLCAYQVQTTDGMVTVRHGDGKWIVLEPYGLRSWLYGAVRPLSMPWADRTYGIRYRSQHAAVHGSPTPIGTLPNGVGIKSDQGRAFQDLVRKLMFGRVAGVKPQGATIEMLEAQATAGAGVFKQIVECSDADIAIALLGQDGTLQKGPVYTPPMLQGVRFDLVELDAGTVDVGFTSGALVPWALINWGSKGVAPYLERVLPDPEKEERDAAVAKKHDAFSKVLKSYRDGGAKMTPEFVGYLAEQYGVEPPTIEEPEPVAPPVVGAPPADAPADEPPASGERTAAA